MPRHRLSRVPCLLLALAIPLAGAPSAADVPEAAARPAVAGGATDPAAEESAPTPYTAEQIRDGNAAGRMFRFRVEEDGRVIHRQTRFLSATAEGAEIEASTLDERGTTLDSGRSRVTWEELQGHARFPRAATQITEERVATRLGTFDAAVYWVAGPSGTRMHFVFAKDRPGPPVKYWTEIDGRTVMSAEMVEFGVEGGAETPPAGAGGGSGVHARTLDKLSIPADSPRWDLQGQAGPAEFRGRRCLLLDGGEAVVKDFAMRDGVIDVDVATPARRGFFGIEFRMADDGLNAEWVYLRQHKSGLPDALQYTPVLNTGLNWQIYNGPGFTGAVEIPGDVWFHLRLEVVGAQARFFVEDMDKPALVIDDLKSGVQEGQVALAVLAGETCFSDFEIRKTPDAAWEHHSPSMPPGTLTRWKLSPSYDALERDLERPLQPAELDAERWQEVEAEPPGFVVINRYRDSPHPKVSFARDFSKRLEPQPGMKLVYARTSIESDRDQVKKLLIGYSDDVTVFLNGRILFRGRSAQNFRDPGFLGIVNPENDAVYLPLMKGSNELMLAVSELGGGWGFICRLEDPES